MAVYNGAEFQSKSENQYMIVIADTWTATKPTLTNTFPITDAGFKLEYQGGDNVPYSALKASGVKFAFIAQDSTGETALKLPFETNNTTKHYVIIWKDEVMYWWGYLSAKTLKTENVSYPKAFEFEAVDLIALSKEIPIWSIEKIVNFGQPYVPLKDRISIKNRTPHPPITRNDDCDYRFGQATTGISNLLTHLKEPLVPELLGSLLFDKDQNVSTNITIVEHWDFHEASGGRLLGGFGNTKAPVDPYLFADYPLNTEITNVTAYEMLDHICEISNARLLQYGGRYYFIQAEIYQFTNTVTYYDYAYQTNSTTIDDGSATWDSTDYIKNLTHGTYPHILSGSYFSRKEGIRHVELDSVWGGAQGVPVIALTTKLINSNAVTNLAPTSQPKEQTPKVGSAIKYWPLYTKSLYGGVPTWRYPVTRERADNSTSVEGRPMDHHVAARLEASTDIKEVFTCQIAEDDQGFSPLKAINIYSKAWLWDSLKFSSNMDEWEGEFIEMSGTVSGVDYGEITTVAV